MDNIDDISEYKCDVIGCYCKAEKKYRLSYLAKRDIFIFTCKRHSKMDDEKSCDVWSYEKGFCKKKPYIHFQDKKTGEAICSCKKHFGPSVYVY